MRIGKLMCIAHAGGSASSYLRWNRLLDSNIRLIPLEYAGRGIRTDAALYENMDEAVADLIGVLEPHIADETPYALYGHSLGALVAYELASALQQLSLPSPTLLIVSGKNPPHMRGRTHRHTLPEKEFREEIVSMGGTPPELLQDESFAEYFMPIARSDFKLVETYRLKDNQPKLHTSICVLNGTDDTFIEIGQMNEWRNYCVGKLWQQQFPGGHFFLHEYPEQVVGYLNRLLVHQPVQQLYV
ncbi:thioesterase II family protein [Paenibacillus fonticola]|uniref:thioesterase II family protein n=1 Tax=Paenibacillus fonticola TaxID=379896 RepID=UPI00036D2C47|nr:alpha/beta fold hydrolase [Paenibacillus fonticola]